jgi:predicted TIM-barrel fold metal-dependent hydrolase
MDRRSFLVASAAAAAPLAATQIEALASDQDFFAIIDTHQHLWNLDRFRLPWHKRVPALAKSYVAADYQAATAQLPKIAGLPARIVKTVYMEVDLDPAQQVEEAQYVLDTCRQGNTPMSAAVISGRPNADDFGRYLDRFKGNGYLKGLRQVLHVDTTPPGYCLDRKFIQGIRQLGERGLSFDVCIRAKELPDAIVLVDACPDTRFILDHCGNPDVQAKDHSQWKTDIASLAKRKNVVGKVSGILASAKPGQWTADELAPIVRHTLDVFGGDRVIFGGDWPVCTLAGTLVQWVEALARILADQPIGQQRKLFHDNAARFYGLA